MYSFTYSWLYWLSPLHTGFLQEQGAGAGACSGWPLSVTAFLTAQQGSRRSGFSSCGTQAFSCLQRAESSKTRDQTHIPCIGGGFLCPAPQGKSKSVLFFFTSGQDILNHLDNKCYCVSPDTPPPSVPHSESARRPVDKVSGLTKGETAKEMDGQGNFSKSLKNQLKLPY